MKKKKHVYISIFGSLLINTIMFFVSLLSKSRFEVEDGFIGDIPPPRFLNGLPFKMVSWGDCPAGCIPEPFMAGLVMNFLFWGLVLGFVQFKKNKKAKA